MGSKASMLSGQLGELLIQESRSKTRFVDLFAGSGAVAKFVAQRVDIPTVSVDQLGFSSALTGAVTRRDQPLNGSRLWKSWNARAEKWAERGNSTVELAAKHSSPKSKSDVLDARALCENSRFTDDFIWADYGGHYFSPLQAFWLSAYRATISSSSPQHAVELAALIRVASKCSASPGHTAQPFQPSDKLIPHIATAWRHDVSLELESEFVQLASAHSIIRGTTFVGDAETYASKSLRSGDLVFCDPPYSEAQYSRFYHVLEGIYRGGWPAVLGAGRAPEGALRPKSRFSGKTTSKEALEGLLASGAKHGSTMMITYPEGFRSNGLAAEDIRSSAEATFEIATHRIPMRHSTLGGSDSTGATRPGSRQLHELIFVLTPRAVP